MGLAEDADAQLGAEAQWRADRAAEQAHAREAVRPEWASELIAELLRIGVRQQALYRVAGVPRKPFLSRPVQPIAFSGMGWVFKFTIYQTPTTDYSHDDGISYQHMTLTDAGEYYPASWIKAERTWIDSMSSWGSWEGLSHPEAVLITGEGLAREAEAASRGNALKVMMALRSGYVTADSKQVSV